MYLDFTRTAKAKFYPYIMLTAVTILLRIVYDIFFTSSIGTVINYAIQGNRNDLFQLIFIVSSYTFLNLIAVNALSYVTLCWVEQTMKNIKLTIFKKIATLPMSYFDKQHTGDLFSTITNDLSKIYDLYSEQFVKSIYSILYGACAIFYMVIIDWRISIIILSITLCTSVLNIIVSKSVGQISDKAQEIISNLMQHNLNIVDGFEVIKSYNLYDYSLSRFKEINDEIYQTHKKRNITRGLQNTTNFAIGWINLGGVLAFCSYFILSGSLGIGSAVMIIRLLNAVNRMLMEMGNITGVIQITMASLKRVYDIITLESTESTLSQDQSESSLMLNPFQNIRFDNVNFQYDQSLVINKMSFIIRAGERIALIGLSGSGKSTVVKLLMRFYSCQSGNIYINDNNIQTIPLHELRHLFAYVSQEPFLFHGSIYENILIGNSQATQDQVVHAAKLANIHKTIQEFKDGYDTQVGERGLNLSGGQRQRIAIARAFLKNAPILILDEATSSVDFHNELELRNIFNKLSENRTVIYITHRLSTVLNTDRILVIHDKTIAEEGTSQELLKSGKIFPEMCRWLYK